MIESCIEHLVVHDYFVLALFRYSQHMDIVAIDTNSSVTQENAYHCGRLAIATGIAGTRVMRESVDE